MYIHFTYNSIYFSLAMLTCQQDVPHINFMQISAVFIENKICFTISLPILHRSAQRRCIHPCFQGQRSLQYHYWINYMCPRYVMQILKMSFLWIHSITTIITNVSCDAFASVSVDFISTNASILTRIRGAVVHIYNNSMPVLYYILPL